MIDFDEYIRQGEPQKREKSYAWQTAIGLQAVDGLKPSDYLIETARKDIEGGIDVNNNMQVIKKDGGFFPNLYAAGEVTYDGSFRPGPTAVGLYQGHIAAQNILRKSN